VRQSPLILDVTLYEGDAKTVELLYQHQDETNRNAILEWQKAKTETLNKQTKQTEGQQ